MSTHGFESRAQVRRAVRAALLLAPAFAAAPFALAQDRAASAAAREEGDVEEGRGQGDDLDGLHLHLVDCGRD